MLVQWTFGCHYCYCTCGVSHEASLWPYDDIWAFGNAFRFGNIFLTFLLINILIMLQNNCVQCVLLQIFKHSFEYMLMLVCSLISYYPEERYCMNYLENMPVFSIFSVCYSWNYSHHYTFFIYKVVFMYVYAWRPKSGVQLTHVCYIVHL